MKTLTLILTLICFATNSFASVLLISPLVQFEQRTLPKELNNDFVLYSEYYLKNFPKEKNVENLLSEFENAQKYYLVKSFELARQYYERVIAFSDMDEWKDIHRKIIFLSYVRLGEINTTNQEEWFSQALRFSMDIDPTMLELAKDTLKKILKIKSNFVKETMEWSVSQFKHDFRYILINGHIIDLSKIETVKIPTGKFRVTFLSDIYKPQILQVSAQQIPLIIPTKIPFLSGSCEKPYVNNEGEFSEEISVYYSKDCLRNLNDKKWIAKPAPTPDFSIATQVSETPIYKKPWFLIAAGVVSAFVAFQIHKKNEKKPTHETVSGF